MRWLSRRISLAEATFFYGGQSEPKRKFSQPSPPLPKFDHTTRTPFLILEVQWTEQ